MIVGVGNITLHEALFILWASCYVPVLTWELIRFIREKKT